MTETDRALERLRSANPVPGIDHVDADELGLFVSYFEERRDVMTDTKSDRRGGTADEQPRRLRPVAVFATALVVCLVVVGALTLLMRGETSEVDPAASVTVPSVTAPPEATTVVETTTVVPTAAVTVSRLSSRSEFFSSVAVGSNGLPIVASYAFSEGDEVGMLRLFWCADAACEEVEVVDVMEAPWLGRTLELAAAPNGDLYLQVGESVEVHRDGDLTTLPLMFNWPSVEEMAVAELPVAFMDDGRPVFVGAMGEQGLTLVICDDATCGSRTEVPIEAGQFLQHPGAFVEGDTIRVAYAVGAPTGPPDPEAGYDGADMVWTTKVATVTGIDGIPSLDAVIVNEGRNEFPTIVTVAPDGSLVMWLYSWQGGQISYSALSCRDADCSKADAVGLGGWAFRAEVTPALRVINAVAETVFDPVQYEAYLDEERRIAEQGLDAAAEEPEPLGTNIVVIECVDTGCTTTKRSTIAAKPGWWHLNSLATAVATNGTTHVLIADDGAVGGPGMQLHSFPDGMLENLAEPYTGTAVSGP